MAIGTDITTGVLAATASEGGFNTRALWESRNLVGAVPATARSVMIELVCSRLGGSAGNVHFDDFSGAISETVVNQWNVDGGGSFNISSNWLDNAVPTDDALFRSILTEPNAPATVTLDSPVSLNSVQFENSNQYILAGPSAVTLTGDREVSAGGTHRISADIAGTVGLVKTGLGTLVLENANSYTGSTDVQAGTLLLNSLDAIDNQASSTLNTTPRPPS